jgi:hypothetical protein
MVFAFCFAAFAQVNNPACPTISVTGPSTIAAPGESMKYYVNISSEVEKYSVEYIWTVSSGKIISGQGGKTLEVIDELGKNLTVMLEVKGLPEKCSSTASETSMVSEHPSGAVKSDEFDTFGRSDTKGRLDSFFVELMNDPYSEGFIVFRNDKDLMLRIKVLRNHIAFRKFYVNRITLVISDKEDQITEFWRVPGQGCTDQWKDALIIKLEDFEKLQKLLQPKTVKTKTKK